MPRQRYAIPRYVSFDMFCIAAKIKDMSDEALGQWFRTAVINLCSGCIAKDVDPIIEDAFERSKKHMLKVQEEQANKYQNRKSKQEAVTRNATDESLEPSCATFEDAANGNAAENVPSRSTTTTPVVPESATSSSLLHGTGHNTSTHPLPLGDTTAPCNQVANGGYDQEKTRQQSASPAEAPLSASPDSGNGNAPDETAKSSFVAIVDDRSCKSGKSGDAAKRPYGEYRHVMLTNDEGRHLREVYGSYLETAIGLLDSYIENGGKAAKKYKNHEAVLRKGNWVWQKIQDMKLSERRLENASRNGKSFAEQDREARRNFLTGNDKPEGYVDDNELTYEELIAKYGVPGAM